MNDLISRQAAIKAIHDKFDECIVWDESGECTANEVERALDEVPAVDAVPVVRCKDCKHNSLNRFSGNALCNLGMDLFHPYDFCSQAERCEDGK